MSDIPVSVSLKPVDDKVIPFQVEGLHARGRIIRLGAAVDTIITRHNYPKPVSNLLGEAIALTVLLGSALKEQGRFQLQARSEGPVHLVVVDFEMPDKIRACARFDQAGLESLMARKAPPSTGELLGKGHLALTVDPGGEMKQYQGIVPLVNTSLEEAAHLYFEQSEQIPTRVRLAVAEAWDASGGEGARHTWRAGGVMVQYLPSTGGIQQKEDDTAPDDDAWVEARSLVETVEDHELTDPSLSSEQLLYRLFHERGVRVFPGQEVHEQCHCSESRVRDMLLSFSPDDKRHMADDHKIIDVMCDFCSTHYRFDLDDILDDTEQDVEAGRDSKSD